MSHSLSIVSLVLLSTNGYDFIYIKKHFVLQAITVEGLETDQISCPIDEMCVIDTVKGSE